MKAYPFLAMTVVVGAPPLLISLALATSSAPTLPNLEGYPDPTGTVRTFNDQGAIDQRTPFFQPLGTNGRACASCHQAGDGWTVTPPHIQDRFEATGGTDPIFRPIDGATCPNQDVSTLEARRSAYSLLLSKGLIRISLQIPANAEFAVTGISDPYGCSTTEELSVYRRPLPATNLRFLSTVMWDGRETAAGRPIPADLISQARDAALGHEQATQSPSEAQLQQIVSQELGFYTAQGVDHSAGELGAQGANGGPLALSKQPFFLGINDSLGKNPTGQPFNPQVFTLFIPWEDLNSSTTDRYTLARGSVARGEAIFNTRPVAISDVPGLTDQDIPGVIERDGHRILMGTCTSCHDTPNVGDHSLPAPLNIGVSDGSRRTPDLPLFTLSCPVPGHPGQTATVQTSDPGRALITGKCADIGKVKGPILRGLAARAPYFHNGSAATLDAVVDFYDDRFQLGLTDEEKADLVAFLRAL